MNDPELLYLKTFFDSELEKYLEQKYQSPSKLLDRAIRYALSSGGKRLRPLLVICSAFSCVKNSQEKILKKVIKSALSVELAHTYSLVHDDLSCMDNDDYRRGKLSVHAYFGECMGVLVGDALLADSFFLIAQASENPIKQVQELALSLGSSGMVAGQVFDMCANLEGAPVDWQKTNQLKTARLFETCSILGGLSVSATPTQLNSLRNLGDLFGRGFQIKDDMYDNQGLARSLPQQDLEKKLDILVDDMKKIALTLSQPKLISRLINLVFFR